MNMVREVNKVILKTHDIKLPIKVLCQKQELSMSPVISSMQYSIDARITEESITAFKPG